MLSQISTSKFSTAPGLRPPALNLEKRALRSFACFAVCEVVGGMQVLSNEEKRTVYDVYGKHGLESGMEVGECLRNPDELRKEYERFKAQRVPPLPLSPLIFQDESWVLAGGYIGGETFGIRIAALE
jgi:hypothetical protein